MTQEERWLERFNDVKSFIETNHRNPSKYYDGEKLMKDYKDTLRLIEGQICFGLA